jgi:hypothetical protein
VPTTDIAHLAVRGAHHFYRIHTTLRVTPEMATGVTDRLLGIGYIVKVLEDWEDSQ